MFILLLFCTDICTSENLPEVEVFSLLDEKLPAYKLRADSIFSHSNCDWIKAPLYFDEQQISELTNEQIQFTLDYFSNYIFAFLFLSYSVKMGGPIFSMGFLFKF